MQKEVSRVLSRINKLNLKIPSKKKSVDDSQEKILRKIQYDKIVRKSELRKNNKLLQKHARHL